MSTCNKAKLFAFELAWKKQSRADFPFTDVWISHEIFQTPDLNGKSAQLSFSANSSAKKEVLWRSKMSMYKVWHGKLFTGKALHCKVSMYKVWHGKLFTGKALHCKVSTCKVWHGKLLTWLCLLLYVSIYAHIYVELLLCMCIPCKNTSIHTYIHTYVHTCMHLYVCMYTYIHTYIHTYILCRVLPEDFSVRWIFVYFCSVCDCKISVCMWLEDLITQSGEYLCIFVVYVTVRSQCICDSKISLLSQVNICVFL
jgi:hypothetical protein